MGTGAIEDRFSYQIDDGVTVDTAVVTVAVIGDEDGDGVADDGDNCRNVANPDQRDIDGDGFGNLCDGDLNNDGMVKFADLAAFRTVFSSADPDADVNGSGLVNFADLSLFRGLFGKPPGPSGLVPGQRPGHTLDGPGVPGAGLPAAPPRSTGSACRGRLGAGRGT